MAKIRVVGIDAAFANMGLALASIDVDSMEVSVDDLILVTTEGQDRKMVRKNSDDLRRAIQLHTGLKNACSSRSFAIAEVPTGSQSARASWSLGIAVGVLAACPIPLIQVTPTEVKVATVGTKTASKEQMIEFAMREHPKAPWKMRKVRGELRPTNDNEHLADAVGCVYAGLKTDQFAQAVSLYRGMKPTARTKLL